MPLQGLAADACLDLPESNGAIVTAAGEGLTIGAEGNCPNPTAMSLQSFEGSSVDYTPQLNGSVFAGTC
jgi:hypothetical protein